MTRDQITEEIQDIYETDFALPCSRVWSPSCTLQEAMFDELDEIEFCMVVEERFGVKLDDDDLHRIKTFQDYIDLLVRMLPPVENDVPCDGEVKAMPQFESLPEPLTKENLLTYFRQFHNADQGCFHIDVLADLMLMAQERGTKMVQTFFEKDTVDLDAIKGMGWTLSNHGCRFFFERSDGSKYYLPTWVLELTDKCYDAGKEAVAAEVRRVLLIKDAP